MTAPLVIVSAAMAVPSGYYKPLVREFSERGWECRVLPTRGFERDAPPASRTNDWSYATEVDAIATAVAAARAEDPDRPVILLGHSLGGQLGAMHELHHPPSDGFVVVGGAVPHFRSYPYGGLGVLFMGLSVPVVTRLVGHLPKPFFGAPGARTMMREWAGFVRSGRPPFDVPAPITTPTLVVKLKNDHLAVSAATDAYVEQFLDPDHTTRWTYVDPPEGGTTHHVMWVKTPGPVVDRVVEWWSARD